MTTVDIKSINGDYLNYRYNLKFIKENSKSIYCESMLYGDVYRIEKATGRLYRNGKLEGDTCEYFMF